MDLSESQRATATKRITIIGGVSNVFLSGIKILAGVVGHSHALIADGFHSLADLATDGLVLFAAKFGGQAADIDHPYGHGRIETLATGLIAFLLIVTGIGIIYDAAWHLAQPVLELPHVYVILVAISSIVIKEVLFRYTRRVADKFSSELLRANAWHHRSDALSSIVVLIGLVGVLLGLSHLDALSAIVVGFMVVHMGWDLAWTSIRELIDTAVNPDTLELIQKTILNIDGVKAVHQLRTRLMRGNVLVDVHVMVAPHLSVSEGHHISEQVYVALNKVHSDVTDVTVHIDPEDDEVAKPCIHLPSREILLPKLMAAWQAIPETKQIKTITLHYLNGKIDIELQLPFAGQQHSESLLTLAQQFQDALDLEDVGTVTILLS